MPPEAIVHTSTAIFSCPYLTFFSIDSLSVIILDVIYVSWFVAVVNVDLLLSLLV